MTVNLLRCTKGALRSKSVALGNSEQQIQDNLIGPIALSELTLDLRALQALQAMGIRFLFRVRFSCDTPALAGPEGDSPGDPCST